MDLFASEDPNRTSISDVAGFRVACLRATESDEAFAGFRHDPSIAGVIEHVSEVTASQCEDIIIRNAPSLLAHMAKFKTSDSIGTTPAHKLRPTTTRYVKVLSELVKYFGDLAGFRIIEIGGGYGGLCKIVHDVFAPRSYIIVDLPEVLLLADRFLRRFDIAPILLEREWLVNDESFDLVISTYALSECTPEIRADYLKKVVAVSTKGYVACNFINRASGFDNMSFDEVREIHPEAVDLPEDPPHPDNRLFVWGNTYAK